MRERDARGMGRAEPAAAGGAVKNPADGCPYLGSGKHEPLKADFRLFDRHSVHRGFQPMGDGTALPLGWCECCGSTISFPVPVPW